MAEYDEKLEKLLLERGLLKPAQIEHIRGRMAQENISLEEILLTERLVFPEQLAQVRAEILGVPYIDLAKIKANSSAMQNISKQAAATYRFVAFDEKNGHLLIAMEAPDDFQALEAIKFIAKKKSLLPEIYLGSREGINTLLGGAAEIQAEIGGALKDFSQELEQAGTVSQKEDKDVAKFIEEAPVTKVMAVIIRHAIDGHASDIHVEPGETDLRIRYRIDGDLHTSLLLPRKVHAALISRIKILSNLKIDETRLPQDGRFSTAMAGQAFDFRVSTMPTTFGEKAALRILNKSQGAPSFDDLGLVGAQQKKFIEHLQAPHGIILISGPTGSGKSTTLFTSLTLLNKPDVNIATLEDPVEYEIPGVNQTQVNADIGLTFASGLRNLLRQDPDVMMVGEIRDKDTAELAVHASLTGHLVLSTIHTNDALGTVPRLVDMGIDPFLLTATLRILAAQRLVARLCQECKREIDLTPALKEKITHELAGVPEEFLTDDNQRHPTVLFESPGCPACHEAGSIGRIAIFEVVPVTRGLRDAINAGGGYDTLQELSHKEGNLTMRQDGLLKVLTGEAQYEDVMRVTSQDQTIT